MKRFWSRSGLDRRIVLALLLPSLSMANGELPAQYQKVRIDRLGMSIGIPPGWRYVNNQAKLQPSFAVVKELPKLGERMRIGLSVFAVDNLGRGAARPLDELVEHYVASTKNQINTTVENTESIGTEPYSGMAMTLIDGSISPPHRIYRAYFADRAQDRLLIINFEAPVDQWATHWPTGSILIQALLASAQQARAPQNKQRTHSR